MTESVIICEKCGAKCQQGDLYCRACFSTLSQQNSRDREVVEGVATNELIEYLGPRSDYYIEKFSKTKKKRYLQLNIAALLFGPGWFFYRKMYKVGVLYVAALILFSSFLSLILPIVFQADVVKYYEAKAAYNDYVNSGGEKNLYKEPPYSNVPIGLHPTYKKLREDLVTAQKKIKWLERAITLPTFVLNTLFRLCANCFYKNYIRLNIHRTVGGVNMKAAVFGQLGAYMVNLAIATLLNLIPIVFAFANATQTLYHWLI